MKCPINNRLLATKSDYNTVYVWDIDSKTSKNQNSLLNNSLNQVLNNDAPINSQLPPLTLRSNSPHSTPPPPGSSHTTVNLSLDWAKSSYRIGSGTKH